GLDLVSRLRAAGGRSAQGVALEKIRKALTRPITDFKGVREKTAARLERLGIKTAWDALWTLPRDYEERLPARPVATLRQGEAATVEVRLLSYRPMFRARSGVRVHEGLFEDDSGTIGAVWYNYRPAITPGRLVRLTGLVEFRRGRRALRVPEVEPLDADEAEGQGAGEAKGREVRPIYPLTQGLRKRALRNLIGAVMDETVALLPEAIPPAAVERAGLPPLGEALRVVHRPPPDADFEAFRSGRTPWHRRLAFEELFFIELDAALRRADVAREAAVPCPGGGPVEQRLRAALPFELTGAQKVVLAEIGRDLSRPHPMHRLLQGDVGCGKTVVALLACARAIDAGLQATLMAPTEILADQHFRTIEPLLREAGVGAALLTAATPRAERSRSLRALAEGALSLVIGTHALIEESVQFRRLGLVVVDEQHRFGVAQRLRLHAKGEGDDRPHMLVMTATPIPRSLALTIYGDLDLSVIDALPPGRKPVETRHFTDAERSRVYDLIRREVSAGRQAFIVYPLVSESEKLDLRDATRMYEALCAEFGGFRVGLIHGQLRSSEKDETMAAFKRGDVDLLVSTTVIEVGIDVPNATLMVVEHAERFGLSQLHQLRGRVGRGAGKSRCLLLTAPLPPDSPGAARMKILEESADGFRLAEEDLRLRGPGDFLGARQHGFPDFRTANLLAQTRLISQAREAAQALVAGDKALEREAHRFLRLGLSLFGGGRGEYLRSG
ncbi:MAG: ATP-dependent DNA helicase RecG, partial [Deltaproteobacteria bacterium]|nr:ATP-dependent DNA helicase RecG [Deltaproteobacteria bacterium]